MTADRHAAAHDLPLPKRDTEMTDDLGFEDGELTPFMKGIGLALMGLHAAMGLAGFLLAS